MKFVVAASCICDSDKLDRPRIWVFETRKEALNYAHRLCSEWIEIVEFDEDNLRKLNELYLTEGKYEYENDSGYIEFDVKLDGGFVQFVDAGEMDVRVFEI